MDYRDSLKGNWDMEYKLFESEWKVMELVWGREPISAKDVSLLAAEQYGWNKNTTYTVIKKCEAKGILHREEPGFMCTALISREDVCRAERQGLIDKLFGGSRKALFSALIEDEELTREEIEALRSMIDKR
jgi:predicted transcriptional regulator